jgi:predicted AAA+ superfamily ATPase
LHFGLDFYAKACYKVTMKRYIQEEVVKDLGKKMVFITGPRQVGKTYLAKSLQSNFKSPVYLNYDDIDDALIIQSRTWPQDAGLIIFDEIHKMKEWKKFLKGTFDTRPDNQTILVTGSARLETFRQTGESLPGRYFHYRLNPLSIKELAGTISPSLALSKLNTLGGFPEPFLSDSEDQAKRWRRQYYTNLIREDILDFSKINEIRSIGLLVELLRKRTGSPLSLASLARDLQIAPNTVGKYISILESLYIIFLVRPFHKNIARAILKEPKVYFYDSGYIDGDEGKRLENTIAICLLKHIQYLQDAQGKDTRLHYIKTKGGKEIDFALSQEGTLQQCIEVKLSDAALSNQLKYFQSKLPDIPMVQLVHNLHKEKEVNGISIVSAGNWLAKLSA